MVGRLGADLRFLFGGGACGLSRFAELAHEPGSRCALPARLRAENMSSNSGLHGVGIRHPERLVDSPQWCP